MSANQTDAPLTIYTIGHSNAPADRIVELLARYQVKLLVDVRSTPYSRHNPQFNRQSFARTLEQTGIQYRYLGDKLGGWPKDPTCYVRGDVPQDRSDSIRQVDYEALMTRDFFQNGIRELLEDAQKTTSAVLCSEEDPAHCHRHHLIGVYLTRQGANVLHIRGDGNIVKDEDLPVSKSEPSSQPKLF